MKFANTGQTGHRREYSRPPEKNLITDEYLPPRYVRQSFTITPSPPKPTRIR